MDKPSLTAKDVFDRAHEIADAEECRAYLDEACAGDTELRRQVEALLQAYDEAGDFLQVAPGKWLDPAALPTAPLESPGSRIKQYKMLQ